MKCLEAQSYIMPFIDEKVPENKQEEFVIHMKNCPKCHEELEIYYTLMVGMRQLDRKEGLSNDFKKDMENGLDRLSHKVRGRRGVRFSYFSVVCLGLILALVFFYESCLTEVYAYEQKYKWDSQGNYYFYTRLNEDLHLSVPDRVVETNLWQEETEKEESFYSKIQTYQYVQELNANLREMGRQIDEQDIID